MIEDKIFVDTNILVYAYDNTSGAKYTKNKKTVLTNQSTIGVIWLRIDLNVFGILF